MALHKSNSKASLERLAQRKLTQILSKAQDFAPLKKKLPLQAKKPHISVNLVSSDQIKKLNSQYRKKDSVTDVLSFSSPQIFFDEGQIGDIVICLPVLKRQAKREGHSAQKELQILLVHGFLHLLGFDHERGPRQAKEMQKWEAKILGKLTSGLIDRNK